MFLLLQLAAYGQETKYKVTVNSQPEGTLQASCHGTNDYYSRWEYAPGEQVSMSGSLRQEYSFVSWTDESGQVLCDSLRYTFTMPNHDVTLVAHTEYDPENPPGPREDGYTDTWFRLYLRSNPSYGGGFQWGLGDHSSQNWLVYEGYVFTVTAYPNTNYKFVRFEVDGETVSTENPYTFTMPNHDMTLYAVYEYDPETPVNPNANVWNKESGELIISDFTPGGLYQKVWDVTKYDPWHADVDKVKSGTVAGKSTDEQALDTRLDCEAFADCANIEYIDFSRTNGITKFSDGCFYYYDRDSKLTTVVLPASTTTIGKYAFYKCNALTNVTCFATTPPTLLGLMPGDEGYSGYGSGNGEEGGGYGYDNYYDKWAFDGLNKDNIIIHVPAESVPLYQEARGWKEFMILPITQNVSRLTVNLPQATDYQGMKLEMVNAQTGQGQHYIITDRTAYTFNNVIHKTTHHIYIKNARGDIMGRIEGVEMIDRDVQVSFDNLKAPVTVTLRLTLPDGTDATDHATVTWTDRQGNFLQTGATLSGQMEGAQVRYRVKLDETLGREYQAPTDSLYTIEPSSIINCQLSTIPQLTIGGTVTSESTGSPIRGATVAVSQLLNGLYTVTQTATTDVNGQWTLTVRQAKSDITASHSDYVKQTLTVDSLTAEMPTFSLHDLTGNTVHLDLYYHASVAEGEESTSDDSFSGAENISYSVYDMTHQREITDLQLQYPKLILAGQELEPGTELQITAISMNDLFMPTTATCTIDSAGQAIAIIGLTEMGQLKAKFEMTDNLSVMGLLFNGNGSLVGWSTYNNTELHVSGLPDGQYTLVTMGYNSLFTSVSSLEVLAEMGIDEDNMISTEVTIRSGRITEVDIPFVPAFDETRFLLTGDGTSLTANKQEVSVGQYVTLRATVNFKSSVSDATDVELLFDLPEGCEYVEQSMMVGNHTMDCQQDGRRLSVSVTNLNDAVRFCVVPTRSGLMDPVGYVSFTTGGRQMTQPIGSATISAEDLTISVPTTTARRSLPVTGMATPLSLVQVYDGEVLIGETTSLGTGYWKLMCPLNKPYNLSEHAIYAIITTPENLQMQSETKTVKINRAGLTPVVSCRLQSDNFEHKHFDFKWDFRTNEATPSYAALTTSAFNDCQQTFEVNFYDENDMVANDTTVIRDVTLYVKTTRGDIRTYPLTYSERHKSWWIHLDWHDRLPVNVDLDYTVLAETALDRAQFEDAMAEAEANYEENRQMIKEVYADFIPEGLDADLKAAFRELDDLLDRDDLDDAALARRDSLFNVIIDDPDIIAKAEAKYAINFSEVDALYNSLNPNNPDPETVLLISRKTREIMANATQPDIDPDEEEMAAERARLQALSDSIVSHAGTFRDVIINSMSWFMQTTDTTALQKPEDGYSDVVKWDDGYKEVSYRKIGNVNGEQLKAEGYTEYPLTDGTFIYLRKDGETVSYIDSKTSMLCTMTTVVDESSVTSENASRRAASGKPSKYPLLDGGCLLDIIGAKLRLFKQEEQLKDSKDLYSRFKTTCATIEEVFSSTKDALACIYDEAMKMLQPKVDKDIKDTKLKGDNDLKKAEDDIAKWREKIAQKKTYINNKERAIKSLEKNEKMLAECVESGKNPFFMTELTNELKSVRNELNAAKNEKKLAEQFVKGFLKPMLEESMEARKNAEKFLKGLTKNQNALMRIISKLPKTFQEALKIGRPLIELGGGIAKFLGTPIGGVFKVVPLAILMGDNWVDITQWKFLSDYIERLLPCPGEPDKALQVYEETKGKRIQHTIIDVSQVVLDAATLVGDFCAATVPVVSTTWWLSLLADCTSIFTAIYHPRSSANDQDMIRSKIDALKCDKKPEPGTGTTSPPDINDPNGDWVSSGGTLFGSSKKSGIHPSWRFKNVGYIFDPAGYVYEAVNSNRVEGVTASCYYKEIREDAYGDLHEDVVLWDAAQYAQENPLFTDADGQYRWDVPPGLWQVKYEKEGYETTYSDWLPVPPPQLEVNVGITQYRQPNVQKVKAYTDGIDISFDKYMDPDKLTIENIFLISSGQNVNGTIELLNAEDGYQKPGVKYASKIRFKPTATLPLGSKVQLTVRRTVESYAGVAMESDFTQEFDVEQHIKALMADSLLNMQEGKEHTLLIKALPAQAAMGKKVMVTNSDSETVSHNATELTLDQNGEAQLSLQALTQGSSIIRFTLADNEELSTTTLVNVRDSASMTVSAPRSSRLNGITLYQGSEIQLTCATARATILYTLNGACPCDVGSKSVYIYDAPIIMTGDSIIIKAMAVVNGMEDSPVVEFRYKGVPRPTDIEVVSRQAKEQSTPVAYYRLDGRRTEKPQRGLNIMRHRNGSVSKVVVK